jgi:monovalent cation/hydrogen antiporter
VFLLESTVFAIIGLELPGLVRKLPSSEHNFALVALAVTATLLAARVIWVAAATFLPGVLNPAEEQAVAPRRLRVIAVTSWAGTRGVVPLAAALSVPLTTTAGDPFPHRDLLLLLAATCTAVTLVVQGMTLGPLARRSGLVDDPELRTREEAVARHAALAAALARLDELRDLGAASPAAVEWMRREFTDRVERAESRLRAEETRGSGTGGSQTTSDEMRQIRRELINVESARLIELVDAGVISEPVRRRVQRIIDLEEARSTED